MGKQKTKEILYEELSEFSDRQIVAAITDTISRKNLQILVRKLQQNYS